MNVRLKEIHKDYASVYDVEADKSYKVLQNRHGLIYSIKGESGEVQLCPASAFVVESDI